MGNYRIVSFNKESHVLLSRRSDFIISCGYYYSLSTSTTTTTTTTVSTLEWIEFTQISYMKSFDDKLTRVQNMWGSIGGFNNKWGLFFLLTYYMCIMHCNRLR